MTCNVPREQGQMQMFVICTAVTNNTCDLTEVTKKRPFAESSHMQSV